MATTTLLQLRTRVRQRADVVGSDFVTDAEINDLISTAYKELYALLVSKSLNRAETAVGITITGAASYALPTDFFALIGIYRTVGEDQIPLDRFPDKFRPGTRTGDATMYRIQGSTTVLYPKPTAGTYTMLYVPAPAALTVDADTVNGVVGWEEFLVVDAAICILEKEESDTSKLEFKRERILRRIADEAQMVELTETARIQNVRADWRVEADEAGRFNYRSADDWDI
jgi:hypothetical protein